MSYNHNTPKKLVITSKILKIVGFLLLLIWIGVIIVPQLPYLFNPNAKRNNYYELAETNILQGKPKQAIKYYSKAIEENPQNATYYIARAYCYTELKNYLEAEKDYSKALTLIKFNEKYIRNNILNKSFSVHIKFNHISLVPNFLYYIYVNPKYIDNVTLSSCYNNLANIYLAKKDFDSANFFYSKALELYPTEYYYYNYAFMNFLMGKFNKVIELKSKEDSAYGAFYILDAFINFLNKQYNSSLQKLNYPFFLSPLGECMVPIIKGSIYLSMEKYQNAIKEISLSVKNCPQNLGRLHLSYIYNKLGMTEESKKEILTLKSEIPNLTLDEIGDLLKFPIHKDVLKLYSDELLFASKFFKISSEYIALANLYTQSLSSKDSQKEHIVKNDIVNSDLLPAPKLVTRNRANDLAVIVGIENYRKLPSAEFAKNDALAFKEYLLAIGFEKKNIKTLINEDATKTSIQAAIEVWLKNKVKKESTVVVYYSGHGSPDITSKISYLVPYDGDLNYLPVTAYPLNRMYQMLTDLNAKIIYVILDACFSGAGGRSLIAKGYRPVLISHHKPKVSKKLVVLTASRENQISLSSPQLKHGLLTYFFLKAIKEKKRDIIDIYQYVLKNVENTAIDQNVEQTPKLFCYEEKKGIYLLW